MMLDFNNSAERVFGDPDSNGPRSLAPSPPKHQVGPSPEQEWEGPGSDFLAGLDEAFDGNYAEAARMFKGLVGKATDTWTQLIAQFSADVMEVASYPGGPQSLAARVVDTLTRTLIRQRRSYSSGNSGFKCAAILESALATLKIDAGLWANLLMRQRALQIWEPVLGPDHPRIVLIRQSLSKGRQVRVLNPDSDVCDAAMVKFADGELAFDPLAAARIFTPKPVVDLLHLDDASPARLLEQLKVLESASVSGQEAWREISLQKRGRSKALLGVYYSFIGRFEEAEAAFQASERHMEHETCVEIKLLRMLWYAEHKTRVGAWDNVWRLMCAAHRIFIANDSLPEFVVHHFPNRFSKLYSAITARLPIDKIINDTPNPTGDEPFGSPPQSPVPGPLRASPAPQSPATADSTLSLGRLFPSTPRGINGGIDIDVWREFVQYSPAPTSPQGFSSLD
jgi:hypothetical protein